MKKFNLKTGRIGEQLAKEYLLKNNYEIIDENYKTKYGEIDLIFEKNNQLVFVEVRTKKNETFGSPEESLDKKKLRKILLNAKSYISIKKWQKESRIDAICIVLNNNNSINRLNHYENIV